MSDMHCQNCNIKTTELFEQKARNYRKNCSNKQDGDLFVCQWCRTQFDQSESIRRKIIDTNHGFKLVIGGPGTGKTYLFKSIIEDLPENSEILVITFINNLVEDLDKQLCQIPNQKIEVRTLNGYCKGFLLKDIHQYIYFPELPQIVEKDFSLINREFCKEKLGHEISNIERDGRNIRFYLSRAEYYNAVSHNDALYRVYLYLKENINKIPKYTLVIIDEYQDFNRLEAELIDLLAQKNKIVISGDDDQALYRFKSASPEFIRDLYKKESIDRHYLVYCRRCTLVLVSATNALIQNAINGKKLKNRIEKEFKCYWPDKYIDSRKYPKITLGKCSAENVAIQYIKKKLLEIVERENIKPSSKEEPEFLIVGPPRISHYLKNAYESLSDGHELDPRIWDIEHKKDIEKSNINAGYEIIKKDIQSNLGWRIILYHNQLGLNKEKEIIRESFSGKAIIELLPEEYVKRHREKAESASEKASLKSEEANEKIRIKLTTYLGAKGLSANHVFILGLENGILPKNRDEISEDEICQFIVLLTRARKSLDIVVQKSFNRRLRRKVDNLSIFVSMIPNEYFDIRENIKAADFKKAG